ncbi:hypothetical protein [Hahella ganghwensis]|uniref:hypothetical protein n=1 Tax=Hahella ganghwensis TaxID=286420 RepID=UPI00037B1B0D|nr:hypothetical protein [Hahella ganghwensis]
MAGDWIKLDHTTPDKPEVFKMAELLDIDPDAVSGKLLRIWIWADQQTIDGNAKNVTKALLDRITAVTGFADAMLQVGWLSESGDGMVFPDFGKHNGNGAKKRAESNRRVAKHRNKVQSEQQPKDVKRECNAKTVTKSVTREEKRREDSKDKDILSAEPAAPKKPKRKSALPPGFEITDEMRLWAQQQVPGINLDHETENFKDHHQAKRSLFVDWVAAWRTWMRNAVKFNRGGPPPLRSPHTNFNEIDHFNGLEDNGDGSYRF